MDKLPGEQKQWMRQKVHKVPSPQVTDSPFPAFRADYRYRGVYERAGFDVYKGANGEKLVRSHRPLKSADDSRRYKHESESSYYPSNVSSPSLNSQGTNEKHVRNPYSQPSSYNNLKELAPVVQTTTDSGYDPYQTTTRNRSLGDLNARALKSPGNRSGSTVNISAVPLNPSEAQNPPHTAQGLVHDYQDDKSFRNYSGTTAVSSINEPPIVILQDTTNVDSQSEFNFSPQLNPNKNFMNLSLSLNAKQSDNGDNDQLSETTIENDRNDIDTDLNDNGNDYSGQFNRNEDLSNNYMDDTNETTVEQAESVKTDELLETPEKRRLKNSNGLPTPPKSGLDHYDNSFVKRERLSDALNDFKQDFHQDPYYANNNATPVIQVDEPRLSYANPYHDNNSNSTPVQQIDPSTQFESFRRTNNQEDVKLNTDYQRYLNSNKQNDDRKSQLSMVSSIISKESKYSEDDNNDSEVESELERQLQNLKTGGASNPPVVLGSVDNDDEVPKRLRPNVASLNRNEPQGQMSNKEVSNDNDKAYPDQFPEDVSESSTRRNSVNDHEEHSQPPDVSSSDELNFGNPDSNSVVDLDPSTPEGNQTMKDNVSLESIKPLTVRHSRSRTRDFELPDISKTPKQQQEENVLDEPQEELPAVRLSNKIIPEFKYPSGSGPCRKCKETIQPNAKGPMKSIYSKTGELTGQWHRKCFTCSYQDCHIQFNKTTPCYVLDDEAYCNHHYHILNNTLCDSCRIGIEGECIENELQQKWHLHCLKCLQCNKGINSDYYLINDSIFCEADAMKIISGRGTYNDGEGNFRNGLSTNDKVEKRRTRLMHVE